MASQIRSLANRLPNELLTEIFTLTLPNPWDYATTINKESIQMIPPRNLLRVCRRWRDVVSSTPKLWSQWALSIDGNVEGHFRMLMAFLHQYVALSRDSPLSFCLNWRDDPDQVQDYRRIFFSTQCRWRRVELLGSSVSIDAAQLARAPLIELVLYFVNSELTGNSDTLTLGALRVLCLSWCHQSYLTLLPHAFNIEELSVEHDFIGDHDLDPLPPMHFKHLRSLLICGIDMLDALTCPALLHLNVAKGDPSILLSFIQRSRPPLQSLKTRVDTASLLLPSLSLLPSLLSLTLCWTDVDSLFHDEMRKRDSTADGFNMCPLLQDMTFFRYKNNGDDKLIGLICSRWHASARTIRSVTLMGMEFSFTEESDASTLSGPWEPLARCIEDGLVFKALLNDY